MSNCLAQCGCIFYYWYPKRDTVDRNQTKGWVFIRFALIYFGILVNIILCQSHSEFMECIFWPVEFLSNLVMQLVLFPPQVPFAALRCLKIGLDCHSADFLGTGKIHSCPYLVNNSFRWCTGQNHHYVCLSAWVTLVHVPTPVTSAISTC